MKPVNTTPVGDCGVIVGRFQIHKLHKGHKQLIDHVVASHPRVIIFLGLSKALVTRNNPLDFEARKQMLQADYPDIMVQYIHDMLSDEVWTEKLDSLINEIIPTNTVVLYGSRRCFIEHYSGKHPTQEMEQETFESGTQIRNDIGVKPKGSADWRQGVVWAANSQRDQVHGASDVAIWDLSEEGPDRLLLGRKTNEEGYRFVGGFVKSGEDHERTAGREVREETGLQVGKLEYVTACNIDDWRYRDEYDSVSTILYECNRVFGPTPRARDDLCELKFFDAAKLTEKDMVPEHLPLIRKLAEKHPERLKKIAKANK